MNFHDLHIRLIEYLRASVQSGEITERGLARITGISQPHVHNVLKGKRVLSPQMADEILRKLHVDLRDLLHPSEIDRRPLGG
jgi:plasmid maintenance system antidote protein VapI